ncbi:hypothetical protein [Streptomyces vietnamensis]|uniref:Uncharacterized protein n=1 Tax=Streptomyces vietnamensis TaxID=362257 RepID=A0A0B5I003_9ACTN|nr:hypothetical protein [Streptomyces vietnamensis]AJF65956.1 hypothetical protein SVTN_17720 [Streptomyces vietnamensis]
MQHKSMYVIIAVLMALVAALAGSLVAVVDGGKPTVAFRTGATTFASALTLVLGVMICLGVVGS